MLKNGVRNLAAAEIMGKGYRLDVIVIGNRVSSVSILKLPQFHAEHIGIPNKRIRIAARKAPHGSSLAVRARHVEPEWSGVFPAFTSCRISLFQIVGLRFRLQTDLWFAANQSRDADSDDTH